MTVTNEIEAVYRKLMDSWNNRNARGMADLYKEDGEQIGFDGSQSVGKNEIFSHLEPIFAKYPTAPYITKIKDIKFLGNEVVILRAIAGMVPNGQIDLNPNLNTHHTLIAEKIDAEWKIALFQNTPAQFHGRPDLVEQMTEELKEVQKLTQKA